MFKIKEMEIEEKEIGLVNLTQEEEKNLEGGFLEILVSAVALYGAVYGAGYACGEAYYHSTHNK